MVTNIRLGEIPNRYHIDEFSAVNEKIMTYNRKLKKYSKSNTHLDIMETMQAMKYYMNQGFHLNALGKDALCLKLRIIIDKIFMSNILLPIPLKWEKDHSVSTLHEDNMIENNGSMVEANKKKIIQDFNDGVCDKLQVSDQYTVQDRDNSVSNNNMNSIAPTTMSTRSSMRKKVPKNLSNDFLWAK
jgi:hypothetical protein